MGSFAGRDYSPCSGTYGYMFSLSTWPQTLSRIQAPLVTSGIEGIRPDGGRWLGLQHGVRRFSDAVPSSLYSHNQRSCRPQPRGNGDATSRKDTRQDRWRYFEFQLRWSFSKCVFQGFSDPILERTQNVESQAVWLLTRQSRLRVFSLFRRHRVMEPPARKPGKLVGLTSEPLARNAGNSVEMSRFTCEETLGTQ